MSIEGRKLPEDRPDLVVAQILAIKCALNVLVTANPHASVELLKMAHTAKDKFLPSAVTDPQISAFVATLYEIATPPEVLKLQEGLTLAQRGIPDPGPDA